MNIRSIDLQVLIPRATDASRVQQQQNQQPIVQQQQAAEQQQQLAANRQHQVQALVKSEGKKIDGDNEKEKGKDAPPHKKRANTAPTPTDQEVAKDLIRGKNIDIST